MSDISTSFKSISHPIRIQILLLLAERINNGSNFTDLSKELQIESSGKLAFHLEKLKGDLVAQSEDGRYYLTEHGKKAVQAIKLLGLSGNDEPASEQIIQQNTEKPTIETQFGKTPVVAGIIALIMGVIIPMIVGIIVRENPEIAVIVSLLGFLVGGIVIRQYTINRGTRFAQDHFTSTILIGVWGGINLFVMTFGVVISVGYSLSPLHQLGIIYISGSCILLLAVRVVAKDDWKSTMKKTIIAYTTFFVLTYVKWIQSASGLTMLIFFITGLIGTGLMIFSAWIMTFFSKENIVQIRLDFHPWFLALLILVYPFFEWNYTHNEITGNGTTVSTLYGGDSGIIGISGLLVFLATFIGLYIIKDSSIFAKIIKRKVFAGIAIIYLIIRVIVTMFFEPYVTLITFTQKFASIILGITTASAITEVLAMVLAYKALQTILTKE